MGSKHTKTDDIKTKQLKLYGHMQRMPNSRLSKHLEHKRSRTEEQEVDQGEAGE